MFNNAFKKTSTALLAGLFSLFAAVAADAAEFVIFHTSDVHGMINEHGDPTDKSDNKPLIGGYAALKSLINQYKNDADLKGARFMYFDSGDFFQGTPVVDKTKGGVMIEMLNRLEANGATLGNHEFDYSYENLKKQMEKKKFPLLCCNVFDRNTGKILPFATNYIVYAHDGVKVGVIGIDTPETAIISFEKNIRDVEFRDPAPIVTDLAKKLRKYGCDYIILLSHLGLGEDMEFVKRAEGVDLILGGHTHLLKKEIVYAGPNNTPIVHSGSSCENANVVFLNIDDNKKVELKLKSVPLYINEIGKDESIDSLAEEYLKDLKTEMTRVLCNNKVNLYRGVAGGNSPAGFVMADAMRKYGNADVAFVNFGGVRKSIFKGNVTVEDCFMLQPFENAIEVLKMTGAQLKDVYERCLSVEAILMGEDDKASALEQFNTVVDGYRLAVGNGYGFLIPSGVKIYFDLRKPGMHRITKMTDMEDKPIDDNKIYRVAFNDFLVGGGDGFACLSEYKDTEKMGIFARDALIKYIEEMNVIDKVPEDRIFNASLKEERLE